ncbi:MAG: DUF3604 domain-containing protein [Myxococcota bacterium]|nr:DUF3604 domain-containing protein [Myxococcota bacterium]
MLRIVGILIVIAGAAYAVLHLAGTGFGVEEQHAGTPAARAVDPAVTAARAQRIEAAGQEIGVAKPKQILFGDLHVHTTFSFDAFQMSLPMAGGDGAHPVADACDYARHCAALDFWSINDHGLSITPRRWNETIESIRQCNAIAGDTAEPDLVSFLGWEWTQVGTTPENHWGHKNVVVRGLDDDEIPSRPISAGTPPGMPSVSEAAPSAAVMGLLALLDRDGGGPELARYMTEMTAAPDCPSGVPVRELPLDCREVASSPAALFAKLDEWDLDTLVIPHGTAWGFYTPLGSSWDKQLTPTEHDPKRQRLVEVFSGHGNSEEYRDFREVLIAEDGSRTCPEPTENYLPSCWRSGEIIEARCLAEGETADTCRERAATARQHFVDAGFNGGAGTISGWRIDDWQDAGQCEDCFQPAFNYRPKSSVQYIMALGRGEEADPQRFRFGFIASSDNHSARPGTGYKEVARTEFTEQRFGNFLDTPLGSPPDPEVRAESEAVEGADITVPFSLFETERGASFFLNGGLAAVHSESRNRDAIWDAMQRREVYGTSGPRILLWFDLLNAPEGRPVPMGSEVALREAPVFQVRAVGSFEQKPGCPADATAALTPEQLARLCQGECYAPSDQRRVIDRVEIIRIRPQETPDEAVTALVEDPWRVFPCAPDAAGCQVAFSDPEFAASGRDALYYARAIEAPSQAVAADPLGCTYDASGRCVSIDPCSRKPDADECLATTQERAWSSPIFVNQAH